MRTTTAHGRTTSAADILREARRVARLHARMMHLADERGRSDPETVAASQELDRILVQRTRELSGLAATGAASPPSVEPDAGAHRCAARPPGPPRPAASPPRSRGRPRRRFVPRGAVLAPPAALMRLLEQAYEVRPRHWTAADVVRRVLDGLHDMRRRRDGGGGLPSP